MDRPASRPYAVLLLGPPCASRGQPQSVVRYPAMRHLYQRLIGCLHALIAIALAAAAYPWIKVLVVATRPYSQDVREAVMVTLAFIVLSAAFAARSFSVLAVRKAG